MNNILQLAIDLHQLLSLLGLDLLDPLIGCLLDIRLNIVLHLLELLILVVSDVLDVGLHGLHLNFELLDILLALLRVNMDQVVHFHQLGLYVRKSCLEMGLQGTEFTFPNS
jgi:hypothetical protein